MNLLESVTRTCQRLAPGGWHSLLLAHGLDILAPSLKAELLKPLIIDRTLTGFEDFCPDGNRAIEPALPAQSLLYHALASPQVTADETGQPLGIFPTHAEIEAVLNYVFGIQPPTLNDLLQQAQGAPLSVAVFASEYRCAVDTVHGQHADLCFSRTGIARTGTAGARYDERLRCFLPFVDDDVHGIRVMPVHYSAYLAVQLKGDDQRFGPMDFQSGLDDGLDFQVPLHKLFSGAECLHGLDLTLTLDNYQINEKIRHVHLRHSGTGWQEPEISEHPFIITKDLAGWATQPDLGPGILSPEPKPHLVELAHYKGQPLSFMMPANTGGMVHGRHKVRDDGQIEDLNDREGVAELVKQGGYRALHYQDGTADGFVRAICPPLTDNLPSKAAYSAIGATDYFTFCNPRRLLHWVKEEPAFSSPDIWHARLEALSNVRYCANLSLKDQPFTPEDRGITAIVALPRKPKPRPVPGTWHPSPPRPSSLPDAAAGVFGPGWEVGWVRLPGPNGTWINALAGYQMASPFCEDKRICAALGSYWPGVAPDSTRTFEPRDSLHTIIPLTDAETGQGDVAWDNHPAPQVILDQGKTFVRYHAYEYSDYTGTALANGFSLSLTGQITQQAYQDRVLSMYRVYTVLGPGDNPALRNYWPLLSFFLVQRPDAELDIAQQQSGVTLNGWVHRYQMYRRGKVIQPAANFKWRDVEVEEQVSLLVSAKVMLIKYGNAAWQLALESV
jgi:hypothetical protein